MWYSGPVAFPRSSLAKDKQLNFGGGGGGGAAPPPAMSGGSLYHGLFRFPTYMYAQY